MTAVWARMRNPGRAAIAIGVLVALGIGLRLAFMAAYRPAFLGYPDSGIHYIYSAANSLFVDDPWHPVGYAAFLRAVHVLPSALTTTVLLQHALGIASAVLLYLAVRRLGKPVWIALAPAAVVLLGGDQVFLEHAILAEALFMPLLAGALYAAIRSMEGDGPGWPIAAGVLTALSATVRLSAIAIIPLVAAWLLLLPAAGRRQRALRGAVAAGAGAIVILGYLIVAHSETGKWALTPFGAFASYARIAPFADCTKFTPPAGTAWLCDPTPPAKRRDPRFYVFQGGPLIGRYKRAVKVPPSAVSAMKRFTSAARRAQPLDWLRESARDFASYVHPRERSFIRSPDGYMMLFTSPGWTDYTKPIVTGYYGDFAITERTGLLRALRDFSGRTRLEDAIMAGLLLLALLAPIAARARLRLGALLFAGVAYGLLVVPVVTLDYDARYGVPAYGPLAAAAAIGAYGIWTRIRERSGARA